MNTQKSLAMESGQFLEQSAPRNRLQLEGNVQLARSSKYMYKHGHGKYGEVHAFVRPARTE